MKHDKTPVDKTFNVVKTKIDNNDYSFFMRNKIQEEYKPTNIKTFTQERYKIAYMLQDMAILCTSPEISHFLTEISFRLRENEDNRISQEELSYVIKFIRNSKDKYAGSKYIELDNLL